MKARRLGTGLKNISATLAVLAFLFCCAPQAQAFYQYGGEKDVKVASFPQTEHFNNEAGIHFDAGCIYKQLKILWIPVWNYDVRWCGYIGDSEGHYVSISEDKLKELARSAGVRLAAKPPIPVWDRFGGKIVVLVGLLLVGIASKSNKA